MKNISLTSKAILPFCHSIFFHQIVCIINPRFCIFVFVSVYGYGYVNTFHFSSLSQGVHVFSLEANPPGVHKHICHVAVAD